MSDEFGEWAKRPLRNSEQLELTDPPLMGPAVSLPAKVVDLQQALERFEQRLAAGWTPEPPELIR